MNSQNGNARGDQSTMPPLLTRAEEAEWAHAQSDYSAGIDRRYLAVSAAMRARSKTRLLDKYRAGSATRHETVDAIYKSKLRSA